LAKCNCASWHFYLRLKSCERRLDDGSLIPGQTITEDFIIDIIDEGNGTIRVTTTDRNTGDSTTFTVESQGF